MTAGTLSDIADGVLAEWLDGYHSDKDDAEVRIVHEKENTFRVENSGLHPGRPKRFFVVVLVREISG